MSTGRTMTQPEVDTVNWLSSIDQQKHETVFNLSFAAVFCVDSAAVLIAVLHQCSSLLPQIVCCSFMFFSHLFCLPKLLVIIMVFVLNPS